MEILFEDNYIIVCIKPRGVLSEAHASDENMPALLGGSVYPVHRLDRNVGGVMVYAKTKAAAAALSGAVLAGELHKAYTAIVTGTPQPETGTLRDFLYHDARMNKTFPVKGERKGAKEALLDYTVTANKSANGVDFSRLEIKLQTGRTHQIRVQFASRAWPLVGDGKYGSRVKAAYPALYATSLSFPHPKSGKLMQFSAPVPGDFPWDLFGDAHYEIEQKFLIAYPDIDVLRAADGVRISRIEQTYLVALAGETRRVRKMSQNGQVRYIETIKRRVSDLRAVEEERDLDEAQYVALLQEADPTRHPVCKTRYAIPFGGHTVEVDVYDFWQDRATVEVELSGEQEAFSLPDYLHVIRDVTADHRYKNVNLAKELPKEAL